jgi:hypothetical protein
MAETELDQNLGHFSWTLESQNKALEKLTIPSNLGGLRGNSVCLNDFGEDM